MTCSSIKILDTGYVKVNKTGNQETDIVNAGKPLIFKIERIDYSRGAPLENTPIPGSFPSTGGEVTKVINVASVESPVIRVSGVINRRGSVDYDLDLVDESELDFVAFFDQLVTTRGVKCLYDISTDASFYGIIQALGVTDTHNGVANTAVPTGIKHLHVRVRNIRYTEEPNKLIRFDMEMEVTS